MTSPEDSDALAQRLADLTAAIAREDLPVPHALDRELADLASDYRGADEGGRTAVLAAITTDQSPALLRWCERCIEWALAEGDPQHLLDALTAVAWEDFRLDARDTRLRLIMLLWAGKRLKALGEKDLRAHASLFSPSARQALTAFLSEPSYVRELKAAGLEAIERDGRIRFVPRATGFQSGHR